MTHLPSPIEVEEESKRHAYVRTYVFGQHREKIHEHTACPSNKEKKGKKGKITMHKLKA